MKPNERENKGYINDKGCNVELDEIIMFNALDKIKEKDNINTVLDLGCGNGNISKLIKERNLDVLGLDFAEEGIKKAITKGINAKVCNFDEGIAARSHSFDLVWAGDIIEHVFDPIFLLTEVRRVLRKGGYLLASIPNDLSIFNRIRTLFGISYQHKTYRKYGYFKHHTFFSLRLIKYMLRKVGLKILKVKKIMNLNIYLRINKKISNVLIPLLFTNTFFIIIMKK